MSDRP